MRRLLEALAVLPLLPGLCWGAFGPSARGTSAAEFLKLGVGARAVAMGEAFSAVADDGTALYWNPAALTRIPRHSAVFMHAPYLSSSFFDYGAYGRNLEDNGALAGGFQYFSAGTLSRTDETGADEGSFTPYDLAVSAGYARKLEGLGAPAVLEGFSIGLAVKYVRSSIVDSAQTAAVDFGVLTPAFAGDKARLAFTAVNLGGRQRFEADSDPLPMALRLGGSYKLGERWLAALDAVLPRDNAPYAALGTEVRLPVSGPWTVAGRAGYSSRTAGDIDGFTGASFGFGLGFQRLALDYALAPLGSLGLSQRISLSFSLL